MQCRVRVCSVTSCQQITHHKPWQNIASVQNASEPQALLQIALRVPRLVPFPLPQLRALSQVLMRLPANLKSGSPRLPTFRLFALRTKLGSSFKSLSLTPRMGQSYTVPRMLHLSKNSRLLKLCPQSGISPTAVCKPLVNSASITKEPTEQS